MWEKKHMKEYVLVLENMPLNTQDELKRERKWKTNTLHNMSNTNVANVQCIYILTEVGN